MAGRPKSRARGGAPGDEEKLVTGAPLVYRDSPQIAREVSGGTLRAIDVIGTIAKGERLIGMTKGQFSLIDLIKAVLRSTGPASVTVSTWTTGIRDAEEASWLLSSGEITSFRLLTDRSFPARQPRYAADLLRRFGRESIVCTRTHAKFAVIRGADLHVAIRSSMNLNRNPRFEQFDLDESPAICDWLDAHVAELTTDATSGFAIDEAAVWAEFQAALGGGYSGEAASDTVTRDGEARTDRWWLE